MKRAFLLILAAAALAACMTVAQPRTIVVDAIIPPTSTSGARDPQLFVSVERFIDERSERGVLGYVQGGLAGPSPIAADKDLSEAVERYVTAALARKGVINGRSPFALRGTIQRASAGSLPLASSYRGEVAVELTLTETATRARLWRRSYSGSGSANDPQTALAAAFRDAFGALDADDSILDSRDAYLAAGGKAPAAAQNAPSAPTIVSDVDDVEPSGVHHPDDYALIVGVEHYQSIPDAQYGERDAHSFRRYAERRLGVPKENVVSLIGSKATRAGLARYLEEWLPKNVGENSRLWVYYSGHGAPDPVKGTAYLIPWDGDPAFLDSSAYPLSRLYEKLSALKAREIVVVLDACFSGAGGRSILAKGARPLVAVKEESAPFDSRFVVLTASAGNQIAGSLDDQGHGVFSYYLLKGLKGAADESGAGRVTVGDLSSYLLQQVPRAARRQNREQTPQIRSSDASLRLY